MKKLALIHIPMVTKIHARIPHFTANGVVFHSASPFVLALFSWFASSLLTSFSPLYKSWLPLLLDTVS